MVDVRKLCKVVNVQTKQIWTMVDIKAGFDCLSVWLKAGINGITYVLDRGSSYITSRGQDSHVVGIDKVMMSPIKDIVMQVRKRGLCHVRTVKAQTSLHI